MQTKQLTYIIAGTSRRGQGPSRSRQDQVGSRYQVEGSNRDEEGRTIKEGSAQEGSSQEISFTSPHDWWTSDSAYCRGIRYGFALL